jgi:pimeloyl-ACP methyl ester carboxylesterase
MPLPCVTFPAVVRLAWCGREFLEIVMSKKYLRWLVLVVVIAVLAWQRFHVPGADKPTPKPNAVAARAEPRKLGTLAFAPCTLAPAFGTQSIEAQCSTLQVPEDHAKPDGRKISLAIAWVPAKGEAEPDPMLMIAGGPGQSALETFPSIAPAFAEINKKRNIVLVDQRGTGGSNKLSCKNAAGKNAVMEDEDEDDVTGAVAFAARCVAELSKKADLRFYSTTDAIADLEDVRRAIGADKLNLMGVSYGTRVAQQYGKKYPAHVRTITIDGIAPNSLVLGAEFARNLENSLDLQFGRCKKDVACAAKLGDTRARLDALMKTLAAAPPTVAYRDAMTGEAKRDVLTPGHLVNLTRMFAYSPQAAGLLPLEINEAAQGRYEPIMALSHLITGTVGEQIMTGMQLSVICTEDAADMHADPRDVDSLLGQDMVTVLAAQCAVWPKGVRPDGFRAPLTGNGPVLILSGEFDPVTPPRYGEEVHKDLPNSRHLIVRGQGHNVLPVGCLPRLFARFVDTADAKALDAKCLDKVPYAQPFTGFYGWEP